MAQRLFYSVIIDEDPRCERLCTELKDRWLSRPSFVSNHKGLLTVKFNDDPSPETLHHIIQFWKREDGGSVTIEC